MGNKYWQLVSLLIDRSKQGTASWQPTSREGVYALSLPEYGVLISMVAGRGDLYETQDVFFQIVNSQGRVIDTFRDADVARDFDDHDQPEMYRQMEQLFHDARRKALGVDEALNQLITQLKKG